MEFNYQDYLKGIDYPCSFDRYKSVDSSILRKLEKSIDKEGNMIERTYAELKRRTTEDYYDKVHKAQVKALDYSNKVFPTYKFIMPDALADDWLSTVDWHKKYPSRDHSLHQTLTAYIVNRLLGGGNPELSFKLRRGSDKNLLDYCASRILDSSGMAYLIHYFEDLDPSFSKHDISYKRRWARDVFYEAAMIAALFHDMGYPWQYINSLKKAIGTADTGLTDDAIRSAKATMDAIRSRLLIYPFFGYSESNLRHPSQMMTDAALSMIDLGLRETHGLPGALGFMTLNDRVRINSSGRHPDDANYRLVLDWAAVAIMMHDMPKIYWNEDGKAVRNPILRLSFEVDPLSCLISLADILEEFHRPSASFIKGTKEVEGKTIEYVNLTYDFPCVGSEIKIVGKKLHVNYYYKNQKIAGDEEVRRRDEVNQYLRLSDGYIDLTPWGVTDVVCNTMQKKMKIVE